MLWSDIENGVFLADAWVAELCSGSRSAGLDIQDSAESPVAGAALEAQSSAAEAGSKLATENPAFFKAVMQLSIKAGSQILRADSVAGLRLCREIFSAGQVWGTLGPTRKILQLHEMEEEELQDLLEKQVQDLLQGPPDAILIQGLGDLEEAVIALRAARKMRDQFKISLKKKPKPGPRPKGRGSNEGVTVSEGDSSDQQQAARGSDQEGLGDMDSDVPAIGVALVFGSGPDATDTIMGQTCEESTKLLTQEGADLVGCYGELDIDSMVLAVRLIRENTDLPILAFPRAGQRELDGGQIVYREEPLEFASKLDSLITAGANVIGGAEGLGPEYIKAAADKLRHV